MQRKTRIAEPNHKDNYLVSWYTNAVASFDVRKLFTIHFMVYVHWLVEKSSIQNANHVRDAQIII